MLILLDLKVGEVVQLDKILPGRKQFKRVCTTWEIEMHLVDHFRAFVCLNPE
jgi:hypothetical protein